MRQAVRASCLLAASAVREARVGTTEGVGEGTSAAMERRRREREGIAGAV